MAKTKVTLSSPDRQWEIEDAMRTLQRAEAIRKDAALMGGVKKSMDSLNKMMFGGTPKSTVKKTMPKKK